MGIAQLIECDVANVEAVSLNLTAHTKNNDPCGYSFNGQTSGFQPEIESSSLSGRTNFDWEILDINT